MAEMKNINGHTFADKQARSDIEELKKDLDNKIGTNELNAAVESALTTAKESGEFDGPVGPKGDPGNDGISPTVNTRQDVGKVVISFVDVDGRKNVTLYDGKTPEKGTDYWTEEDKTEIVSDVLASLPNASGVSF